MTVSQKSRRLKSRNFFSSIFDYATAVATPIKPWWRAGLCEEEHNRVYRPHHRSVPMFDIQNVEEPIGRSAPVIALGKNIKQMRAFRGSRQALERRKGVPLAD